MLTLFQIWLYVAATANCPSFDSARQKYFDESSTRRAVAALECRVREDKNDLDAQEFLSNLYWWEGNEKRSTDLAKKLLEREEELSDSTHIKLHKRVSRFRLTGAYAEILSSRSDNYEVFGELGARYFKKNELRFSVLRDARQFGNNPFISDLTYRVGHSLVVGKNFYLVTEGTHTDSPNFRPDWGIEIEPHYVFSSGDDISIGFKYRIYPDVDVIIVSAGWYRLLARRLAVGLKMDSTWKPERTASLSQYSDIFWTPRVKSRVSFSGGRTDEGDSIVAAFFSAGLSIEYQILIPLALRAEASIYRGDFRDEDKLGGSFTFYF